MEVPPAAVASLFEAKPRTFRMDRRSAEAASLKAAVSRKLVDFLGNYTDDVLAEYIVVLVCNGKHQNQARNELEAFLGDDSEKFVAWLWQYLSNEPSLVETPTCMLEQKADAGLHNGKLGKEQSIKSSTSLQMQSTKTSNPSSFRERKLGNGNSNSFSFLNSEYVPKELEGTTRSFDVGLAMVREHTYQIGASCGSNNGDHNNSLACKSTSVASVEAFVGNEQYLQLEDSYKVVDKTCSSKSNGLPCESPKPQASARSLRSVLTDGSYLRHQLLKTIASGRLPEATDSVADHNVLPRVSVWDRLGKPCPDAKVLTVNERSSQLDPVGNKQGKGYHKYRLEPSASSRLGKRVFTKAMSLQDNATSTGDVATENKVMGSVQNMLSSPKKRYVGEKGPANSVKGLFDQKSHHFECKKMHKSLQGALEKSYVENRPPSVTVFQTSKSVKVPHNPRPNVFQMQSRLELSVTTPAQDPDPVGRSAQSKPDALNQEDVGVGSKPAEELLNMKERIYQIEREMLELRSKQRNMDTDSKSSACQVPSLKNCPEQDADVRTVFVTNIHFAAPKEALSSFFGQCGPIVRTVLVTDGISGQPKGCAYIVFAKRESADKAMTLNGTSFFSRKLKVMQKTEAPAGVLALNQAPGRAPRPWFSPQSQTKSPFQRQFPGHLQWRRDQASGGSGDNSTPTRTSQ